MNLRTAAAAVAVLIGTIGLPTGTAAAAAAAAPAAFHSAPVTSGNCVIATIGKMECFTNTSDFAARSGQLQASSSSSCPVVLYTGANFSGRSLAIYVRGQWLNLSMYGFDNATVSFIGNGCGFHLADYQWGGGSWYPGDTSAWAYCANMGGWNYRVSSVYVN